MIYAQVSSAWFKLEHGGSTCWSLSCRSVSLFFFQMNLFERMRQRSVQGGGTETAHKYFLLQDPTVRNAFSLPGSPPALCISFLNHNTWLPAADSWGGGVCVPSYLWCCTVDDPTYPLASEISFEKLLPLSQSWLSSCLGIKL